MELQDDILKSFSDAINGANTPSTEGQRSVYATAVEDESGLYVRFDGSEVNTPAISMVECGNGDRVLATWKGHTAVITGNISYPSLTRKGSIYMTMTDDGLVIGTLDENNQPAGYYILIRPADGSQPGVEIIDTQGRVVSHFGLYSSIGLLNGARVLANNSGVTVFNKDAINSAFYGDYIRLGKVSGSTYLGPHVFLNANGLEICNTSNVVQANFYSDWARIGYYTNQHINITTNSVDVCEYTNGQEVSVAKLAAQARIGKESGEHVLVTANTVDIKKGSTVYATFGATTTVGVPTGRHITIGSSTIDVYKDSSNVYASFGDTARIGLSSKGHVKIDQSSVNVYTGSESSSGTLVASFGSTTTIGPTNSRHVQITSSGVNIRYNQTTLASFTESAINLGSNSATISLCGSATMKYSDNGFAISANSNTKIMSISNSGDGYRCYVGVNTNSSASYVSLKHTVGMQVVGSNSTRATTSLILNEFGAYFNTPAYVYVDGYRVLTADIYSTSQLAKFDTGNFNLSAHSGTRKTVRLTLDIYDTSLDYSFGGIAKLYSNKYGLIVQGYTYTASSFSLALDIFNASNVDITGGSITGTAILVEGTQATSYPSTISTVV